VLLLRGDDRAMVIYKRIGQQTADTCEDAC